MNKIYCHYVFRTYKGRSSLKNKEFIEFLSKVFLEISKEKGFPIIAYHILEDHVHLLIQQTDDDNTNYIMRVFKGGSARRFFLEYPSNRFVDRKLWGRGYYYEIIDESLLKDKISYIKDQRDASGEDKRYKTVI